VLGRSFDPEEAWVKISVERDVDDLIYLQGPLVEKSVMLQDHAALGIDRELISLGGRDVEEPRVLAGPVGC